MNARYVRPPEGMEWRSFECSTEGCTYAYIAPIRVGGHPDASGPIDFCPQCEEYMSLIGSPGAITAVSETSKPEWAEAILEEAR